MNTSKIGCAQAKLLPPGEETREPNKQSWGIDEHNRFLQALSIYGRNDAQAVSDYIKTRTRAQVHSHAQKYFQKIDEIVQNSVEQAAEFARMSVKEINWNLLQNGIINEPNYEWCREAQNGQNLILGAAFASQLTQISYYIMQKAMVHMEELRIAKVPCQIMEMEIEDTTVINVCINQSKLIVHQNGQSHFTNLINFVYAEDQFLCVLLARNGVSKFLEKIFRILLIYEEFVKNTLDHPMFIVKNLASFERIEEETVCCILLAFCIQSALIKSIA